jgi:hypothetical protein
LQTILLSLKETNKGYYRARLYPNSFRFTLQNYSI